MNRRTVLKATLAAGVAIVTGPVRRLTGRVTHGMPVVVRRGERLEITEGQVYSHVIVKGGQVVGNGDTIRRLDVLYGSVGYANPNTITATNSTDAAIQPGTPIYFNDGKS